MVRVGFTYKTRHKHTLLRMLACAWDWLEKCACGGVDEHLMALAIVRLSAKFQLKDECHKVALKLLGTEDEKTALHAVECRLAMMMWMGASLTYKFFLVSYSLWRDAEVIQ